MFLHKQFTLVYSSKIFQKHIDLNQTCINRNNFTAIPFSLSLTENNSFKEAFSEYLLSGIMSFNKASEYNCGYGTFTWTLCYVVSSNTTY